VTRMEKEMSAHTTRKFARRGALLATLALSSASAWAAFTVSITVNEFGYGKLTNSNGASVTLPCQLMADPGPGGLPSVLFCGLDNPPGLVAGDLVILDAGGAVSDLLRFNPNINGGGVFIYSTNANGVTAPADVGIPAQRNTNVLTVNETGTATNNGVTYTPTTGQPGFVANASGPVTYTFLSDVPSPVLTKTFGELAIPVGATTSLTFNLANGNTALTGVTFTDILPAGLTVATPNGVTGSCGGGTITATAGSGTITLSGASLAAGASCTFTVNVTATAPGTKLNTTSIVNSDQGISGNPASALIFLGATNVTSQVIITTQGFLPNRSPREPLQCTVVTVMNPSLPPDRTTRATTIAGPLELVLTNISMNATLQNPAGFLAGNPFVILQPGALPPGEQVNAQVCFLNPSGAPITFIPRVYSGALPLGSPI